jgi:SAM-dependent methyltransferase
LRRDPSRHVTFPPRALVFKPDPDDPIDYYYRPLTGWLYRSRLRLAAELLGRGHLEAVLEIGYGSGIFLPELASRSRRLVGVDLHPGRDGVGEMLAKLGVDATLLHGSVLELPFADEEFNAVVCLSVLEHLRDLEGATGEIGRVLRPRGVAVLGFPVRNPITDSFFRLAGYSPRAIHPSGHADILKALDREDRFRIERVRHFPRVLPLALSAYVVCRARRQPAAA